MKPSSGVVSGDGVVPLIHYNDSPGPIGRSVTDAAVLLSAIDSTKTDYVASLDSNSLKGIFVAVLREDILAQAPGAEDTTDNTDMLMRIDAGLLAAGANSVDARLIGPESYENEFIGFLLGGAKNEIPAYLAMVNAPAQTLEELIAFNTEEPSVRIPNGQQFLEWALKDGASEAEYVALAPSIKETAVQVLSDTFESSGASVLVSISNLHSTIYASAGFPAITVPLSLRSTGMPTGATLIGKSGADSTLIGYAFAFEQATDLRIEPELDTLMESVFAAPLASPDATPIS